MENNLLFALQISGIGIVVLLLVLTVLAGLVYLMTRYIVDKPEEEEGATEETLQPAIVEIEDTQSDLKLVAVIALALARAQAEIQSREMESEISAGVLDSWRQFGLHRRLNQSSTIRRTR